MCHRPLLFADPFYLPTPFICRPLLFENLNDTKGIELMLKGVSILAAIAACLFMAITASAKGQQYFYYCTYVVELNLGMSPIFLLLISIIITNTKVIKKNLKILSKKRSHYTQTLNRINIMPVAMVLIANKRHLTLSPNTLAV